jgi:uncharacterized protein (DUF1697 family)
MEKYIAFLRGVNVGGKNKVSMKELRALFERNGFVDVRTYINSGNIIFVSDKINQEELKKKCESLIAGKSNLMISVTIVSIKDLSTALNNAPSWWNVDKNSKHNVIFVIPPVTVSEVFEQVGAIKPEYEKIDYHDRIIFWSAPIKTFSKTRWSKIVGSSVYDSITIRNANTVNKLIELAKS